MIPRRYVTVETGPGMAPAALSQFQADQQATLAGFARYLTVCGRARATVRLYCASVRRWLAFGGASGHVDANLFWSFVAHRRRRCGHAALLLEVKALRAFYRAQHALGHALPDQAARVPSLPRRRGQRVVRWLDGDQVRAAQAQPDGRTWLGFRAAVVLATLAETGIRTGELVALRLGDVLEGWLYVAPGKTKRDRYVPISAALQALLGEWIRRRAEVGPGKRAALFVTHQGLPFRGTWVVWSLVSRHTRAALGVGCGPRRVGTKRGQRGTPWQGYYPHLLRASYATALACDGMPLTALAQLLGHASVQTTTHYLGGVDLTHLREQLCKHHPRGRRVGVLVAE